MIKKRTISKDCSFRGKALHTGADVSLNIKPAPVNHGIVFKRMDLPEKPEIRPDITLVTDLVRNTTIASGHTKVHTIEHILSALTGCGIDNALIEMDASEPPILDGSSRAFAESIINAVPLEQDQLREFFELAEPVYIEEGDRSIVALPYDGFKVTCTSADDRGIHTQHLSLDIDPEVYVREIASARTFTIYEDIETLLKQGKIKGGSLDTAIVIRGGKMMSKEPLRFVDEFVRHKILDIVGDLTLLGKPLKAHIIANKTGHSLNAKLTTAIAMKMIKKNSLEINSLSSAQNNLASINNSTLIKNTIDIKKILEVLPHKYPFLLLDRILEVSSDLMSIKAIKNVTINEPYFQGHFPNNPVMPGVLQIEAMAQAAGILFLKKVKDPSLTPYFMSCDKVKFRKIVIPGDQLHIEVVIKKYRNNKFGTAEGICSVDGKTVSHGELMFTVL